MILSILQSAGVALSLEHMNNSDIGGGRFGDVVINAGWGFRIMTVITLTTGSGLLMCWASKRLSGASATARR